MNVRIRFQDGVLTVFKDNVEVPNVEVELSKEEGRPPTSVRLIRKAANPGQADVKFLATEWQFQTIVPPDMESLVDAFLPT